MTDEGRYQIRPLASFSNASKTHTVALHPKEMHIDQQYAYQNLRQKLDYSNIAEVEFSKDVLNFDPRYKTLQIKTKNRREFNIPQLEAANAYRLKNMIEQNMSLGNQKNQSPAKSRVGSLPMLKFRK